jgi:hypothetical protein
VVPTRSLAAVAAVVAVPLAMADQDQERKISGEDDQRQDDVDPAGGPDVSGAGGAGSAYGR